jgi:poly(hydroxyalkanoate) depolymerase family esterase
MRGIALVVAVLAWTPGVALAAPDPPDPGQTSTGTYMFNGAEFPYLLYTPTSYRPGRAAPLLVMVHGCQTTAETEQKVTLYDRLAEREGFVVLYPEVDAVGKQLPGPLNQCWKFFDPTAYFRGNSDSAAIAEMTRSVMSGLTVDAERVYLVGTSAGGLMASVDAAAYSELYAAVGLVASAGFADGPCFTDGVGIPIEASAQLAFDQMGPRARVVPVIAMGSDADLAFPANCTVKAVEQGLRTNNLVISGSQDGPLALSPAATREEPNPGGVPYTVSSFRDPAGCLVAERWIVHGIPHAWPGGTADPKYKGYTDTRAPSGAEATWAFLERYRRSDTAMPCAEAPCPARTVSIALARGARVRGVVASVAGHRVPATLHGRRVTLALPASPRGAAVRVVLRVRREGRAGAQVVRRTLRAC